MGQNQSTTTTTTPTITLVDDEEKRQEVILRLQTEKDKIAYANQVHTDPLPTLKLSTKSREIIKEDVEGVEGAFLLHNVLSEEECEAFINETERLGYREAPLTVGNNTYAMVQDARNNKRVMWQADDNTLNILAERIAKFLPPEASSMPKEWVVGTGKDSLNERFRFYRYAPEEYFAPHFDGCFPRNSTCCSFLTFIVYLNGDLDGGETTFFIGTEKIKVNPKKGTALLFFHRGRKSPYHEGSAHHSEGKFKYALRSDIMYFKNQLKYDEY